MNDSFLFVKKRTKTPKTQLLAINLVFDNLSALVFDRFPTHVQNTFFRQVFNISHLWLKVRVKNITCDARVCS